MGVLDEYDPTMLDERDYDGLDPEARAAADALMRDRDRREGKGRSRMDAVLASDDGLFSYFLIFNL